MSGYLRMMCPVTVVTQCRRRGHSRQGAASTLRRNALAKCANFTQRRRYQPAGSFLTKDDPAVILAM